MFSLFENLGCMLFFNTDFLKCFYSHLCSKWSLSKTVETHLQPWIFSDVCTCIFRLQGSSIKTFNKSTCPSHLHAQSHNVTMELISVPSIHSLVLLFTRWPPSWFKSADPCQRERQAAVRFISAQRGEEEGLSSNPHSFKGISLSSQ